MWEWFSTLLNEKRPTNSVCPLQLVVSSTLKSRRSARNGRELHDDFSQRLAMLSFTI